jgi:predicted O-methyltransferase YrrM
MMPDEGFQYVVFVSDPADRYYLHRDVSEGKSGASPSAGASFLRIIGRMVCSIYKHVQHHYSAFVTVQSSLEGVSFRLIQPSTRFLAGAVRQVQYCQAFVQWPLEVWNTKFSGDDWDPARIRGIGRLSRMPKMSTIAIGALINRLVASLPPGQAYLNVGVWHGYSFFAGMLRNTDKRCIGIDNFSEFGRPRDKFLRRFKRYKSSCHEFFDVDWRAYFAREHRGKIGVYFYDGAHDYDSQYQALIQAERFMAPGGFIIVDDTNWESSRKALIDFLSAHPGYELLYDIPTTGNCHPTFWNGLMVARKKKAEK